jgi:hypothetical protein
MPDVGGSKTGSPSTAGDPRDPKIDPIVAARHKDARAMVLLGKAALGRRLPLEHFAFPTVGIIDYLRYAGGQGAFEHPLPRDRY